MSPKLLTILLILVPVVLYYGYIGPMYTGDPGLVWTPESSIRARQLTNVQYQETQQKIELLAKEAKNLNDLYSKIKPEDKEKINIMMPDSIDEVKIRNEIVALASKHGLGVGEITFERDNRSKVSNAVAYDVGYSLYTKYSIFKSFLDDYEKNMRFYNVQSLSISKEDEDDIDKESRKIEDIDKLNFSIRSKLYTK